MEKVAVGRGRKRRQKSGRHAPKPLVEHVVFDGHDFGIRFCYVADARSVLRESRFDARYIADPRHPLRWYWRIRGPVLDESRSDLLSGMLAAAQRAGVEVREDDASFWSKCRAALDSPTPGAFVFGFGADLYPVETDVVMIATYHHAAAALAKSMRGAWMPDIRGWRIPQTSALVLYDNLQRELGLSDEAAQAIRIRTGQFELVDGKVASIAAELGIGSSGSAAYMPGAGDDLEEGCSVEPGALLASVQPLEPASIQIATDDLAQFGLYPYQCDGVLHLACSTSALLADDPGLGKTRQAIVAAHIVACAMGMGRILVVAPASLLCNWRNEIRALFPDDAIAIQKSGTGARWAVTNYEQVHAQEPEAGEFAVFIADEAHYLKEPDSERTRDTFNVASRIRTRYLLTGTPILNRESEIYWLLRLSGHPIGQLTLKDFLKQFAGSPEFRRELNRRIAEWMLRRKKNLVLKHLKGRQHQLLHLALTDEQAARYRQLHASDMASMEKVTRLLQFVEAVKVEPLVEFVNGLAGDDKIIIFTGFQDTVRKLAERLAQFNPVTLIGSHSPTRRQRAVDAFQNDINVRAFIATTAAGGTGLNLQAANYVAFASLPWTAALQDQAESRADRNGQTRLVIVKIPLVQNTIDEALWQLLRTKAELVGQVIDPDGAADAVKRALAGELHAA